MPDRIAKVQLIIECENEALYDRMEAVASRAMDCLMPQNCFYDYQTIWVDPKTRRLDFLPEQDDLSTYGACPACGEARTVVTHLNGQVTEDDLVCMNCGGD